MERTEEEMILFDELFNLKARLQLPNNDENTKEKFLKRITEIRDRLAEIKVEQIMKEEEQEMRMNRNG